MIWKASSPTLIDVRAWTGGGNPNGEDFAVNGKYAGMPEEKAEKCQG